MKIDRSRRRKYNADIDIGINIRVKNVKNNINSKDPIIPHIEERAVKKQKQPFKHQNNAINQQYISNDDR